MSTHVNRRTVDLSGFPDLMVIYQGDEGESHSRDQDAHRVWSEDFRLGGGSPRGSSIDRTVGLAVSSGERGGIAAGHVREKLLTDDRSVDDKIAGHHAETSFDLG